MSFAEGAFEAVSCLEGLHVFPDPRAAAFGGVAVVRPASGRVAAPGLARAFPRGSHLSRISGSSLRCGAPHGVSEAEVVRQGDEVSRESRA